MPTPRPRARVLTTRGRPLAVFYSPKEYKAWQEKVAQHLRTVAGHLFEGPVEVVVECYVLRPKTTKLPAPKPDVDNYAKGVLDAITKDGRFWTDDSQVVSLTVTKAWAEETGIYVTIKDS